MAEQADLYWLDNLTPISTRFEDSYYSRQNGLEETRYVFIEGNKLPSRWHADENPNIAELGFGTGLNFLATYQAFLASPISSTKTTLKASHEDKSDEDHSPRMLHFCSFEKFPMNKEDLSKALSPWPDLHLLGEDMINQWDSLQPGWNHIRFSKAVLSLFIGDAMDGISSFPEKLKGKIGAWYLDGFNPKTNPDLWALPLLSHLFDISSNGATFATYTAAGWVRRNLSEAGFTVQKQKGFGHKRDMCLGFKGDPT